MLHESFDSGFHYFLNLFSSEYSTPTWAVLIAGVFIVVSLTLSVYLLFEHLSAYKNPEEQKFLIGVIVMVPCYAVESFISLVHPAISVDIGILRDCYESFAMYCFGRYLVACLGGEERAIEFMEREGRASVKAPLLEHGHERGIVNHPFPMNYFLKPWKLGQWVYQVIKFGIVQYMIIKSLTAISAVILEAFDVYCEGDFKWNCGYPYVAVILNFSQSWALYCLVHFYAITKTELAHIKPLYKFLTFKSIVFLTWWQGVAINLLYATGLVKSPVAQSLQFKTSVQDFIICIEVIVLIFFIVILYFSMSSISGTQGKGVMLHGHFLVWFLVPFFRHLHVYYGFWFHSSAIIMSNLTLCFFRITCMRLVERQNCGPQPNSISEL